MTHLQLPHSRLPSDSTIRRAMMGVDFTHLATAFAQWASPVVEADEERWYAVDGKGLNGSIVAPVKPTNSLSIWFQCLVMGRV